MAFQHLKIKKEDRKSEHKRENMPLKREIVYILPTDLPI